MGFTGKTRRYFKKKLSQKGLVKNSESRGLEDYPATMQAVMNKMQNKGNAGFNQVGKREPDDPQYKSKYEWLFDPVKGVAWDFNPVQLRELAQDDAWVQMLVNTMTTEVANTPWHIVEDENTEVAKNYNPFQRVSKGKTGKQANDLDAKAATRFLQSPNPDDDFSSFVEQLMADRLEVGSMVAPKAFSERDYGGEDGQTLVSSNPSLQGVTVSDPATFTKDYRGKTGIIKGYWQYDRNVSQRSNTVVGRGGARRTKPIKFTRKEIAWKDFNPRSNRRYGLPPTLAVQDILMLLDMTIQQEQDFWSNGAHLNSILKTNADITEMGQLQSEVQGERGRQGGIVTTPDMEAEIMQVGTNWKEMEVTEREKWYAKIIASEFQVPMSVVGLKPEDVNRSTFEGERDNFESNTLGPHLHDIERWITQNIVKPHFSSDLRFEFKPGMSENQRSQISDRVRKEFESGAITRNEFREEIGRDPVDESEDGFKDEVTSEPEQQQLGDVLQQSTDKQDDFEDPCEAGYTMVGTKVENGREVPNCVPDEDVPEAQKQDSKESVGKPFGPWESFEDCKNEMMREQGYDEESAKRVCGSLQAELKEDGKVEKQESFTDYPQAAVENAQMALDAKKDTGDPNDCGTDVGWARANQLANEEPVSLDTVKRMSQFSRHRDNSEQGEEGRADCGWMMWKAWGGDEGIEWAENKVDEVEENEEKSCDQCGDRIEKEDNKRFCNKECYNKFLSKEEDDNDEPLRETSQFFEYDFQPRHVEEFKQELQGPINEALNQILRDDRFNQLVERFAEMEQHDNTQKNSAELRRVLNDLIKDVALSQGIEQVVENQSTAIALATVQEQIEDTGLGMDTDEVERQVRDRELGFVQDFSKRMEEEIRDTVAEGWQQGQSIQDIQENLQSKADDLSDNQAERIARDQLQRATGEARNSFAEQHSDKFCEVWDDVGDNRTRPAHAEMGDMNAYKLPSESFEVEYERANGPVKEKYPGDSSFGIQCRCRTKLMPREKVINNSNYTHRGV